MTGQKPQFRLIQKKEGDAKWANVGAAWERDDGQSYSLSIDLPDGSKMKCLMVVNKPYEAKETEKPAPKELDDAIGF